MKRLIEYLIPNGKERHKALYKKKEKIVVKDLLDELDKQEIENLLKIGALNNIYAVSIDFYCGDIFIIKDCKVFLWKNGISEQKSLDDIFAEYTHQFALDLNQLLEIKNIYS